ncbi:delta-latroinsectotoxin-Lt1a-like [Nasonia vitripennis]|uniref:Uncharacterized protein n=1 Tax=Nasonia vitripennis TaxID=7425 RepID=A0A7M7M651_NASVI|nr:delta-latroinsectotoxin-Lt1a-like [Nasonia vitripennis]
MHKVSVSSSTTKLDRGYLTFSYDRTRGSDYYPFRYTTLDPYDDEDVKRYDGLLHKALLQIFREDCPSSDGEGKRLLCAAEHTDRDRAIEGLVQLEPGLGEIFPKGDKFSLLWIAVLRCYRQSAELLVRSGADVNERCGTKLAPFLSEAMTILHLILQTYPSAWNERFIRLLLEHGADLQARDSHGQTVLHYAVKIGQVKATALLLDAGAELNVADIDGKTALLEAARSSESNELLPLLLEYGADASVRDSDGRNALHHLAMAFQESVDLARALLAKGVSLDDREHRHNQYQPLHYAVLKGKNELVKLFLAYGANVNARSKGEVFPLYLATEYNKPTVLLTLLSRGAKVDLQTSCGRTALHRACASLHASHSKESLKMLLSVGGNLFFEDQAGSMPFDLIREKNIQNPMIRLALKTLALRNDSLQRSIEYKHKMIISPYPRFWKYYNSCVYQIRKLRGTYFIGEYRFIDLLTKCECRMAARMRIFENQGKLKPYEFSDLSSANEADAVARRRDLLEKMCKRTISRLSSFTGKVFGSLNVFSKTRNKGTPKNLQSEDFQRAYRRYVVDVYSSYADDLLEAFDRALHHYQSVPEQEDLINEAVYDTLSWIIVRRMALYIHACEECEFKRIAHESLGFGDEYN